MVLKLTVFQIHYQDRLSGKGEPRDVTLCALAPRLSLLTYFNHIARQSRLGWFFQTQKE